MSSKSDKQQTTSFKEMMLFYKRFLRLLAILPFDNHDYTYLVTRLLLVYLVTLSFIVWTSYVASAARQAGELTVDTICELMMTLGAHGRFYVLLWQRKRMAILLDECEMIWDICDEEGRRVVRRFERKVRLLAQCMLGTCVITLLLYIGSAINMTLYEARNSNGTYHKQYLPFKWYTDEENLWLGYKTIFLLQVVSTANTTFMPIVDTAAPLLIMIGAAFFRALRFRLYRAYKEMENKIVEVDDQKLLDCVRLHQRILNYCSGIDEITRFLFFNQLVATGYNTSLIGIKLAGTDPDKLKYLPLGIVNVGQLFLCQWAPDHLLEESEAISTAAYSVSIPWMRHRVGKSLILMIARAQRPVQMTAAGVVNLSLENFGVMLKGAVSFFTVVRSFVV